MAQNMCNSGKVLEGAQDGQNGQPLCACHLEHQQQCPGPRNDLAIWRGTGGSEDMLCLLHLF